MDQEGPVRPLVVLFKTPSGAEGTDPYDLKLRQEGFEPAFVPVLREVYHTTALTHVLQEKHDWEGVVITSKRGAEGWIQAVDAMSDGNSVSTEMDWSQVPLWTVGTTALDTLDQARVEKRSLRDRSIPQGSLERTAKSATHLLPLMLSARPRRAAIASEIDTPLVGKGNGHAGSEEPVTFGKYLVIRGDKSLDEIPQALRQHGRETREIVVYTTEPRPDVRDNLDALFHTQQKVDRETWLAFFSPSSAGFVLDLIPYEMLEKGTFRFFAIGETTRKYLVEQGLRVDAVADTPTPDGLLDAIVRVKSQAVGHDSQGLREPSDGP